jgi:hypothetical protein
MVCRGWIDEISGYIPEEKGLKLAGPTERSTRVWNLKRVIESDLFKAELYAYILYEPNQAPPQWHQFMQNSLCYEGDCLNIVLIYIIDVEILVFPRCYNE